MPKWPGRFWSTPSAQFDDGMALSIGEDVGDATASKQDLDALLPMSGTVIIDSSLGSSVGSNRWLPLTEQVGEMRGCNLSPDPTSGGIVLNEIGQWDVSFRCQVAATGIVAPENEIRLETWFDGNMVDRQYSIVTLGMAGNWNLSVDATVIVDEPGYWVRVYTIVNGGVAADVRHSTKKGASRMKAQYVYNGTPRFAAA